jgi:hypothetical protein
MHCTTRAIAFAVARSRGPVGGARLPRRHSAAVHRVRSGRNPPITFEFLASREGPRCAAATRRHRRTTGRPCIRTSRGCHTVVRLVRTRALLQCTTPSRRAPPPRTAATATARDHAFKCRRAGEDLRTGAAPPGIHVRREPDARSHPPVGRPDGRRTRGNRTTASLPPPRRAPGARAPRRTARTVPRARVARPDAPPRSGRRKYPHIPLRRSRAAEVAWLLTLYSRPGKRLWPLD